VVLPFPSDFRVFASFRAFAQKNSLPLGNQRMENAMKTYKVIVVGMGKRGKHHAAAFKNNPRFELAGLCSRDRARLDAAAAELGPVRTSAPHRMSASRSSRPASPAARS
jgi:hypothetical protein